MSQQIQISGGAKVRDLQDVIIGTSGVLSSLAFDVANGVPRLDSNGKILVSQLPNSIMEYKGTWNAATNTPTLANGTGNQGDVYLCNVAGTVDFGAGPISFIVGDSAVYSGSIWQRSGGATGTVTSVGLSTNGGAITIGNSPITTSGTITANFNGTNLQYVNGAGNLTTFPTLITSIGLSMPSAFSVANSPLTANGTIAVTGAGYASQYIRGDGTLADFPSSGGGGSSVSYYLNGGTSQGTILGTTYYEMSKTAVVGTGVDFAKSGDGLIVAFLTDANDPAQLNIPAGNWNYEIYASMSSNGGTPQMYAELYVYNGTTFTLIATSSNEILYDGVNLNLYTFAMAVPATTLTLTDRLAVKLYATNSGGKTTTVHTQDSHLCQVITTFSTGITALNGLTAQVQYFATGTSGTDFNISSTTATHTFNIPDASATARGLITTGTQTIAGAKTFSSVVKTDAGLTLKDGYYPTPATGYVGLASNGVGITILLKSGSLVYNNNFQFPNASNDYNFPNATGTISLTSDLANYVDLTTAQTIGGTKTFSDATKNNGGILLQNGSTSSTTGYMNLGGTLNGFRFTNDLGITNSFTLPSATGYTFTFPNATGTLALTSDIPSITGLVPYTGATNNVGLGIYSITASTGSFTSYILNDGSILMKNVGKTSTSSGYNTFYSLASGFGFGFADFAGNDSIFTFSATGDYTYTFPAASGTIALVGGSGVGTVTSVAALTIGTTGTDLSSTVANSTTTPVITLNVPTASATNRGALSSADWTTFNNKQSALTNPVTGTGTTNYIPKFTGTSTIGNSSISDNGSGRVSIGTTSFLDSFVISASGTTGWEFSNLGSVITYNRSTAAYIPMTFEASNYILNRGNLGLGVTPSAWQNTFGSTAFQLYGSYIYGYRDTNLLIGNNAYYDGTWKYYASSIGATKFNMGNGAYDWSIAPSGTAGAAITFTQAMTLTASGRLLINKTNEETYQLDVNGTGRFSNSVTFAGSVYNFVGTNRFFAAASGSINYLYTGSTNLTILNQADTATLFTLANSGAATFSSSVTATSAFFGSSITSAATLHVNNTSSADPTSLSSVPTTNVFGMSTSPGGMLAAGIGTTGGTHVWLQGRNVGGAGVSYPISLQPLGGNVGIGTVSPQDTSGFGRILDLDGTSGSAYYSRYSGSSSVYCLFGQDASNSYIYTRTTPLIFYTNATERMRITSGGNVLIGTTTDSGYKLDVNGTGRFSGVLEINSGNINTGNNLSLAWNSTSGASIQSFNSKPLNINPLGNAINFGGAATFSSSVTATSFFESSSIKGKDIIATNPLLALDIDVIKYTRKNDESKDIRYGYSAEQIHSLMPELTDKDVTAVKYLDVHTILIAQLQQEIKELKAKMN